MERNHHPIMDKDTQQAMSPDDAQQRLIDGNHRFTSGKANQHDFLEMAGETASGQYPFAAILCCLDSRVSPELTFDQSFGDLFVARIAGNFVNDDIIASLEFATIVSGSKIIVVMGHTSCGAILNTLNHFHYDPPKTVDGVNYDYLTKLPTLMQSLNDSVVEDQVAMGNRDTDVVAQANVRHNVQKLNAHSGFSAQVQTGNLKIVGAMHELSSGKVTFGV